MHYFFEEVLLGCLSLTDDGLHSRVGTRNTRVWWTDCCFETFTKNRSMGKFSLSVATAAHENQTKEPRPKSQALHLSGYIKKKMIVSYKSLCNQGYWLKAMWMRPWCLHSCYPSLLCNLFKSDVCLEYAAYPDIYVHWKTGWPTTFRCIHLYIQHN